MKLLFVFYAIIIGILILTPSWLYTGKVIIYDSALLISFLITSLILKRRDRNMSNVPIGVLTIVGLLLNFKANEELDTVAIRFNHVFYKLIIIGYNYSFILDCIIIFILLTVIAIFVKSTLQ